MNLIKCKFLNFICMKNPFHIKLVCQQSEFAFLCAGFGWRTFLFGGIITMKTGIIIALAGAICLTIGLFMQNAIVAFLGFVVGVAGLCLFIVKKIENKKEIRQSRENFFRKLKEQESKNSEEIKEHLAWLRENYNVSTLIKSNNVPERNKDCIVAIDEEKQVILFGCRAIEFSKIFKAEISLQKDKEFLVCDTDGVIVYLADIAQPLFKYSSYDDENNQKIYAHLLAIIAKNEANKS